MKRGERREEREKRKEERGERRELCIFSGRPCKISGFCSYHYKKEKRQ